MFYDKFVSLCNQKQVSPSKAAIDAGISKSLVTKWKNNKVQVPSPEILQKLSAYFHVPVSALLDEKMPTVYDGQKENPGQPELTEAEEELLNLFRQVPKEHQPLVLDKIRAAVALLGG